MNLTDTLKEALYSIKVLKQELNEKQNAGFMPIAIVGMGCRFPQANNKEEFWQLLLDKKNVISAIPPERWKLLGGTEEESLRIAAKNSKGGFLGKISEFDPYFFGLTPREAAHIDPQQRLLLEVAYEACEDAGLTMESLAGSNTGVFASLYASQFPYLQKSDDEIDALHIASGNAASMAANRLSYLFDWHGPSMVVDTACSSSLVALNAACANLQNKSCDVALVCGANINLLPSLNLLLSKAKMLSPDGQCKTFDASANGYVPGEGVAVIVLKSLAQAQADKDRIYAVIAGSAVNQDGKTNGLTAPNGLQQEAVIRSAFKTAKINPMNVGYVECHGTGTLLGDPIEVQALGDIISLEREPEKTCWIGSLKTNLGHLEPAAGVASIMKVALALHHAEIPPHLNFSTPNPYIAFDQFHFSIPTDKQPWPLYGSHRVAGVSGFGFGGTNAHVVLREADPVTQDHVNEQAPCLFTLSAKDVVALTMLVDRWCDYLERNPQISLAKLCYNLHLRRSHYPCRIAILAKSRQEVLSTLKSIQGKVLDNDKPTSTLYINIKKEAIQHETHSELENLALSYVNRQPIDWKKIHEHEIVSHCDMPLYPWQNQSYWPVFKSATKFATITYPFYKDKLESPLMQYEFKIDSKVMPEIADTFHFLHAGFYVEMLTYAVKKQFQQTHFTLHKLHFDRPIVVPKEKEAIVQLILEKQQEQFLFHFYSKSSQGHWVSHAAGTLSLAASPHQEIDIDFIKGRCNVIGSGTDFANRVIAMKMPAQGSILWTHKYWMNDNEIICKLVSPVEEENHARFDLAMHLGVVDSAIQSLFMLLPANDVNPYIAAEIGNLILTSEQRHLPFYIYAKLNEQAIDHKYYRGDIYLLNVKGELILALEKIQMMQLNENIHVEELTKNEQDKFDLHALPKDKRKAYVTAFISDKIANLFSIPQTSVTVDTSLKESGMDSLMAMALTQAIEAKFHQAISLQRLFSGATIADLTQDILQGSAGPSNPWIPYRQAKKNPKIRLFCFPYGGAGASIYSDWHHYLPDFVDICPIQYPGREERINEPSINEMPALIDVLCENLKNELHIPFILFGHSMGALVAFEFARALRERHMPLPQHLIVSAFPDPRMPTKSLEKVIQGLEQPNAKPFDVLKQHGLIEPRATQSDNNELINIILPIFLNDIGLMKHYRYQEKAPLDTPLTLFTGKNDRWLANEDQLGWRHQTSQTCDQEEFDSEHLFIKDEKVRLDVFNKITTILSNIPSNLTT